MKLYAIYNEEKGYLCEDEDVIGLNYSKDIDESTLLFFVEKEAKFNMEENDKTVEVTIDIEKMNDYLII